MKSFNAPQGEFIQQLRESKKTKSRSPRFDWSENVSKAPGAEPASGKLDDPALAESRTKLTDELPKTKDGNLDVATMRTDLVSQMKRGRKKASAS